MSREELQMHDFDGLGIIPALQKRLKALNFLHPTPIQYKAIPIATSGEDVVGIAQTGSGKTLAFTIPVLQTVASTDKIGLILLPTRELAVQVEETIKKVAENSGLRTALVIGGTSAFPQVKKLKAKPHVIIATPGRLIDHLEQKNVFLDNVGILVLDEADRMLDMGFEPQLKRILATVPSDRQTMLFSATMPEQIANIAKQYMKQPLRIEVAKPGTTVDTVDQEVFIVSKDKKLSLLKELLNEYQGKVLVFSRTKYGAKKIANDLRNMRISADEIHSNRSQAQRQHALRGFTKGDFRVLVATDIAARGIDVSDIEVVINYDLPEQAEDYVHRIGRTGRAGKSGKAISFAMPEQQRDIKLIESLIRVKLPVKSHGQLPVVQESSIDRAPHQRQGRGSRKDKKDKNNRYQNQSKSGPRSSGSSSGHSRNRRPSRGNSRGRMR